MNNRQQHFAFNNTNYKLQSFMQIQIPFVSQQSSLNITYLDSQDGEAESYEFDGEDFVESKTQLHVQVCGIYNTNVTNSTIPYTTQLKQEFINSIYLFKNNIVDIEEQQQQQKLDIPISEYRLFVKDMEPSIAHLVSNNLINLRSKKKMFPKIILKYEEVSSENQKIYNKPYLWSYKTQKDLKHEEIEYLRNYQNQQDISFLNSQVVQCSGSKKCGYAITIFYVFSSDIGKFHQPFVEFNFKKLDPSEIPTIDFNEKIQGEFQNYNRFQYFKFQENSKKFIQIRQKKESAQPIFQICSSLTQKCHKSTYHQNIINSGKEQPPKKNTTNTTNFIQVNNQQEYYYMVITPSKKSGGLLNTLFSKKKKKQNFEFSVQDNILQLNNDQTMFKNLGNDNTFLIKIYNPDKPLFKLEIGFLSIQANVPKTKEFINGHTIVMDQQVIFCKEQDYENCDFTQDFDMVKKIENSHTKRFIGVKSVIPIYSQQIQIPQGSQYAIIHQNIFVSPNIMPTYEPDWISNTTNKYPDLIGIVQQTISAEMVDPESSGSTWEIIIFVIAGLVFCGLVFLITRCIIQAKKNAKEFDEKKKLILERQEQLIQQQENEQKQQQQQQQQKQNTVMLSDTPDQDQNNRNNYINKDYNNHIQGMSTGIEDSTLQTQLLSEHQQQQD